MVSLGAWKMKFAGNTVYPCGSIDTNFDPPEFPLDSTFKYKGMCIGIEFSALEFKTHFKRITIKYKIFLNL